MHRPVVGPRTLEPVVKLGMSGNSYFGARSEETMPTGNSAAFPSSRPRGGDSSDRRSLSLMHRPVVPPLGPVSTFSPCAR